MGLLDRGRKIKELIVCRMLLNLILRVFLQKRRDLATLSYPWLLDLTLQSHGAQPRPYEVFDNAEVMLHRVETSKGFIITWILHQIFMFSNKVNSIAG